MFKGSATPAAFWQWFATAAPAFRDPRDRATIDEISARLSMVAPDLRFQLGRVGDGWQLEISADGIHANIPVVEAFVAAAPPIAGWRVVAFRQPSPNPAVRMGDRRYSADSTHFVLRPGTPPELDLYLAGYDAASEQLQHGDVQEIAFLMLDAILGEYIVMTRLGAVYFHDDSRRPAHARPLRDLAAELAD
jgi:hypothetical protein